jgi:folate-binding protein YgfZ
MNSDAYRRILAGEALTFILSPRALWRLSGPDATRYLNGQVTNDVTRLAEGDGGYAAVCNAKGRMEGDVFIARHGGDFYLDAAFELRESLGARLDKYLVADDALFEDVTDLWSVSHVFGPGRPPEPAAGFIVPRARYGLPGHDVWVPSGGAVVVGGHADAEAVETLRLEHGVPLWGAELTTATLPPEAGPHMLAAISYTKGCYVGQETIARLKSVGHVNRTLVFLQSDSAKTPSVGARLKHDEKEVGTVTSAGFSPRLDRGIALAYVPLARAAEGAVFFADDLPLTVTQPLAPGAK